MFPKVCWIFCFAIHLTYSEQWYSKSQCTQKEFANHMDINCQSNEFILIGWSHYGTKQRQQNQTCQPADNDCIMDYTHKIAELCNGLAKCEVILTQQFIHKCSDEANYLFISYQCIQNLTMIDVCSKRSLTSSNGLNLISPLFPNEYPNNLNCTCSIETKKKSNIIIDVENLSFNLQDNDRFLSLSGSYPFGATLLTSKNQLTIQFKTDETLSQSGFWIRFHGYQPCHSDELTLGSKCLRIFSKKQNQITAQATCLSIGSSLLSIDDIIQEKKLAFYLSKSSNQSSTFWISNNKQTFEHSWWPWRSSNENEKCVLRTIDGWRKTSCQTEHTFICQRDLAKQSIPLTIRCGNAQTTSTTLITQKILTITQQTNVEKTEAIDITILAAILCGIAIVVCSLNIIICFLCKRQTQKPLKSNPNDSNSSINQEELHRSLMHHLYHEQTNTISSTSTSSSSKNSKSNETMATSSNLFQLSSNPSTLCFRNAHLKPDPIDYHVYETIPSENLTYTLCTPHMPINSHPNGTVVMPICCHHYAAQCSTGTLRLPSMPIYARSESIV